MRESSRATMTLIPRFGRRLQKSSKRALSSAEADKQNSSVVRGLDRFDKTCTELAEKCEFVAAWTGTTASRVSLGCTNERMPVLPSTTVNSSSEQQQDRASSSNCNDNMSTASEQTNSYCENGEVPPRSPAGFTVPPSINEGVPNTSKVELAERHRYVSFIGIVKISFELANTGVSSILYTLNQICKHISYWIAAFLITTVIFCGEKFAFLEVITDAGSALYEIFGMWQKGQLSVMKLLTLIAPRRLPTSENSLGAEFEPLLDLMPTVQKIEDSNTSISALTPNLQKVEDSVASSSPPLSPVSAVPGASSFVSTTAALSPISSPNASPSVVLYIQSAPVSPSPKFPVLETDSPAKDTESSRFGNRSFFGSFSKKKPAKIGGSAISPITPKKKHPLISRIKAATEKLKLRRSASFSRTLFDNNPDLKNTSDDLTSSSAPARLESKAFKLLRFASFSDKASSRGQDQPNQCLSPKASAERNSSISRASSMKKMERKSSNRHLQKSLEAEGSTHKIGMRAKSNDSATLVVGLILIVVLSSLMMGRFTSILCTSCSLLVISNVRMAMLDTKSLKKHLHQREFVDYTSSEYKKKVIMDGLRARDFQGFVHS